MPDLAGTRGILDPGRMRTAVILTRRSPTEVGDGEVAALTDGLVEHCWRVRWDLPDGAEFEQPVLTHPSAHLSVGPRSTHRDTSGDEPIDATLVGVLRRVDRRRLRGASMATAVKLSCGALGALVEDASVWTDRIVEASVALPLDAVALCRAASAEDDADAFRALLAAVAACLTDAPAVRVDAARECVAVARLVEEDRTLVSVSVLARAAGIPVRSLQRLFRQCAGVPPLWVIRRRRILDAAEEARHGGPIAWAELAARLGYADQAHLTRDFTAAVGVSPAAYARAVTPLA